MTRSKNRLVAHVVLMSFVVDSALAARTVQRPPKADERRPRVEALAPGTCGDALTRGDAPVTTLTRAHLWPPNHALVDVGLAVDPTSQCAGLVDLEVTVWGDEADDAPTGDSTTTGDSQFDGPDLYLRAERAGDNDGRVYLVITRAATGASEGINCRTVVVPHSGSAASMKAVKEQAAAARTTCEATGAAPSSFHLLKQADLSPENKAPVV